MRPLLFLLILGLIIVSSGCTSTSGVQGVQGSNGLEASLTSFPDEISDKQNFMLTLDLTNKGSVYARNLIVYLYGIDTSSQDEWKVLDVFGADGSGKISKGAFSGAFSFQVGDENVNLEGDFSFKRLENFFLGKESLGDILDRSDLALNLNYNGVNLRITDLESFFGLGGDGVDLFLDFEVLDQHFSVIHHEKKTRSYPSSIPLYIEYMEPPIGSKYDKRTIMWKIRPPQGLPYNQKFDFNPYVRVCYDYKTVTNAKITFYSENEFFRKRPKSEKIDVQESNSPLKIIINSKNPVIADNNLALDLTIKNTGTGTATLTDCDEIFNPAPETFEKLNAFEIYVNGTYCKIDEGKQILYLNRGKDVRLTVVCEDFNVNLNQKPIEERDVNIELKYRYYYDVRGKISVIGTRDPKEISQS